MKCEKVFLFLFTIVSFSAMAQKNEFINPRPVGYSDATAVVGGKTIYVSGQVPVNASGTLVGKGDLRAQTIQVFENIQRLLAQAGAGFTDVVKVNIYVVNCQPKDVAVVREVRKSYLSANQPPASTLVGVTSLVDPDFLVEIEVVAVVH
jgi:enamine deaminase RidA (YjgF/YER057c/UK114 family)